MKMYIYVYRKISTIRVGKYTDIPWIRGLEPCVHSSWLFGMKNFNFWEFYGCDSHGFFGGRFQLYGDFSGGVFFLEMVNWLVVEPTHLKNMLVKLDHFPR